MKQRYYIFLLFVAMLSYSGYAQKSILRLSQQCYQMCLILTFVGCCGLEA